MSTNQPTERHREIAREIYDRYEAELIHSDHNPEAVMSEIASILAQHDRPATATGEGTSRKVEDACEAIKRESERLFSLDRPRPLDLADVREFVQAAAAPSVEPLPSDAIDKLRDLAERAVVALHMHFHAGINKPGFDDCRTNLCADWHDLTRREAFSNGIRPTENI